MMEYLLLNALLVLLIIVISILVLGAVISKLINKYYKTIKYSKVESFKTLLDTLNAIVELEIQMYEINIFENREGLTNANYANFYEDMCTNIRSNLAEDFMIKIEKHVTEEFVYTLIARKVKLYLASKV